MSGTRLIDLGAERARRAASCVAGPEPYEVEPVYDGDQIVGLALRGLGDEPVRDELLRVAGELEFMARLVRRQAAGEDEDQSLVAMLWIFESGRVRLAVEPMVPDDSPPHAEWIRERLDDAKALTDRMVEGEGGDAQA